MDRPRTAGRQIALFLVLAAAGCAADLLTKHWAFSRTDLLAGQVRWLWPGHVGVQLSLNEGALFGMGQGRVAWFAAFSLIACVAIPWWLFRRGGADDWRLVAVLGAVMGGVLGNLYDRLGLHGLDWGIFTPSRAGEPIYAVRDFILFAGRWEPDPAKRIVWPNFNVADALLVCGAGMLLLLSLRHTANHGGDDPSS
ncbi:MAG: signal peptidase II [Planctomycetales bacterium]|nr:signal peptidase II [Planctomycetales bacterium]